VSGSATGWGLNLSSNIRIGTNNTVRLQAVYGEGIQNYFNDAPADVGVEVDSTDATDPIEGKALPILGIVAFLDHNWNEKFSTSVGFSMVDVTNSNGQSPDAFKTGQYAVANLMYMPVSAVMMGAEFQWGSRENYTDPFKPTDYKLQFSFKYNFSQAFYR